MYKDTIGYIFTYPRVPNFANMSFRLFHIQADKVMVGLLVLQWFIASFITSIQYNTYFYGFFGGALIVLPIIFLYKYLKGDVYYRVFISIAMMLFSVIFIQQYLGRIEMHFHVFIAMAILTLYKDIIPIVVAAITTIVHHFIFNYLQLYEVSLFDMPVMIFNYGCGFDIVILHGVFVIAELLVLGYLVRLQIEHNVELNATENRVNELNKELQHSSLHDNLTGLPNRLYLSRQIEIIKEISKENNEKFALIFLDLDHFKNINDTLGHDIGDLLLKKVSHILKENISENSIIFRIGGDEFIILVSKFQNENVLIPTITNFLNEFRKTITVQGYELRLSASIGISIYPDDSTKTSNLMKYADIAMYKSKADGRDNFSFFTQKLNTQMHNEVEIINDMQRAFYANEFELYYQPKIDTQSKKIVGAEALLRWKHHEKGIIGPNIFIPLAESTGFILTLGKFVINESVKTIDKLNSLGEKDVVISVNVSTRQFQNSNLKQDLADAISSKNINSKQLAIEITESIMMEHVENAISNLKDIKQLGISVYLDDFGTGYSSLSYLRKFPIDTLKIDKSFIDDIDKKDLDKEMLLVDTIIRMGQSLGLKIIAEGVEHESQYEYLKQRKCTTIQGYYFSKPVPEAEFMELLKNNLF
ncbi:putative bifunctional diguanylate cyclase/phosphodiesterase [Sulfurimonas sp.]